MCKCKLDQVYSYILREDTVCLFNRNEKMKPRIRPAGADVGAGTQLHHIGKKTQTYKVPVKNIIVANWLDFAHAMATMLATYYIFNVLCDKSVDATPIFFQKYTY